MKEFIFGALLIIVIVIVIIAIFLLLREFFCWYWKINIRIGQMDKITGLLEKQLKEINWILETVDKIQNKQPNTMDKQQQEKQKKNLDDDNSHL